MTMAIRFNGEIYKACLPHKKLMWLWRGMGDDVAHWRCGKCDAQYEARAERGLL
jgi:hypothetical protein